MTALVIRTARMDDLDAIMQLEASGFPSAIRESRDVDYHVYVARRTA